MTQKKQTPEPWRQARLSKDAGFDGQFLFAVRTTGIFCRPSCPAPTALENNVEYFQRVYEALEHGYRPCFRCRPDLGPEDHVAQAGGGQRVQAALENIQAGFLNGHSVDELAVAVNTSPRQLRKLFDQHLGSPPVRIASYHKALFARRMVVYSHRSMTDIAFASGFGSVRQFNSVFRQLFGQSPTEARQILSSTLPMEQKEQNTQLLKYQSPFHFDVLLAFLKSRAIAGVEHVSEDAYWRSFRVPIGRADGQVQWASGYLVVRDCPEQSALGLSIHCDDVRCIMPVTQRVRRMFDLDANLDVIRQRFEQEPLLANGLQQDKSVPRLPVAFDAYEFAIRAILGQQVSVKAANTLAARLVQKAAVATTGDFPETLPHFFPAPETLLATDLSDIGLTSTRQNTIRSVLEALISGSVRFDIGQVFDEFHREFSSIKGIGDWTVNYVAIRGMGMKDCFPAADLGIIKALSAQQPDSGKLTTRQIQRLAEDWRPYRSYAALCLWNQSSATHQENPCTTPDLKPDSAT